MGMSIQELARYFKGLCSNSDVLLVVIIIVTGVGGFALGKASNSSFEAMKAISHEERNNKPLKIPQTEQEATVIANQQYVASKNGTKYHLLWCPGAKQIKEENKVYFESKDEAERAGYTPAANCKGI